MMVYVPVSQIPPPDLIQNQTEAKYIASYCLEWAEMIFLFCSMNIKAWAKGIIQQNPQLAYIQKSFLLEVTGGSETNRVSQIVINIISCVFQSIVFTFAITYNEINRLVLYLSLPAMFAGLFVISYLLGEMISNKLSAFKNIKILKEMSKFIWRNVLLFVVLGAIISGLIDGIFSLWKFLRGWCADQN